MKEKHIGKMCLGESKKLFGRGIRVFVRGTKIFRFATGEQGLTAVRSRSRKNNS